MSIKHALTADGSPLVGASDWNADHSVPTLAEVLVAGNEVGPSQGSIIGTPLDTRARGGTLLIDQGQEVGGAVFGGNIGIAAGIAIGNDLIDHAGAASVAGGDTDNFLGAFITANGAAAGDHGYLDLFTDNSYGTNGQVLVADGNDHSYWANILTSGSGAPGSSFVSLLYLDTTAVSGGCYAWNGSGYTKISGAL